MKKTLVSGFASLLVLCGTAADYTFEWKNSYLGAAAKEFRDDNGVLRAELTFYSEKKPGDSANTYSVDQMNLYPDEGGTITFMGESMSFCLSTGRSYINFWTNDCRVVFQNIVSNRTTFLAYKGQNSAKTMSWDRRTGKEFISSEWTLVAPGKDLKDWEPYESAQGGSVTGRWNPSETMYPENIVRFDGRLTFQFQTARKAASAAPGSSDVKIVKMELKQGEGGIYARAYPTTWYVRTPDTDPIERGVDIDTLEDCAAKHTAGLFTGTGTTGYGIDNILFNRVKPLAVVRFENEAYFSVMQRAGSYTRLEFSDIDNVKGAQRALTDHFTAEVGFADVSGNWTSPKNSDPFSYHGRNVFETTVSPVDGLTWEDDSTVYLPTNNTMVLIARNRNLADVLYCTTNYPLDRVNWPARTENGAPVNTNDCSWGYIAGKNCEGTTGEFKHHGNLFHLKFTDAAKTNAVGQFQCAQGSNLRCVFVRFCQRGNDIYAQVDQNHKNGGRPVCYYLNVKDRPTYTELGFDWESDKNKGQMYVPMTATGDGFNVHHVHLAFAHPKPNVVRLVAGSGIKNNTMSTTGQFIVRGADTEGGRMVLNATDYRQMMFSNGCVRVEKGGELLMDLPIGMSYNRIIVSKGGVYRNRGLRLFTEAQTVTIDGGTLEVGFQGADTSLGNVYGITLKNGARIDEWNAGGAAADRSLFFKQPPDNRHWLSACGETPSTNNVHVFFIPNANMACSNSIYVAKLEGGTFDADFVQNGDLKQANLSGNQNASYFRKTGKGTMLLNGDFAFTNRAFLVEGTLKLGASCQWRNPFSGKAVASIMFEGGNLALADGANVTAGRIDGLSSDAAIALGANAALSFEDSSAQSWTAGRKILITAPKGSTVRFGTNAQGLTARQQRQVKLNGKGIALDADGYAVESGFVLIMR